MRKNVFVVNAPINHETGKQTMTTNYDSNRTPIRQNYHADYEEERPMFVANWDEVFAEEAEPTRQAKLAANHQCGCGPHIVDQPQQVNYNEGVLMPTATNWDQIYRDGP